MLNPNSIAQSREVRITTLRGNHTGARQFPSYKKLTALVRQHGSGYKRERNPRSFPFLFACGFCRKGLPNIKLLRYQLSFSLEEFK